MLVALALGDAYGAGFEFADPSVVIQHNDPEKGVYRPHPKGNIPAGNYTDDTQMTLGLVDFLMSDKPKTAIHLARNFVWAFKRDPRHGYSSALYEILDRVKNGTDFLQQVVPFSSRSGGAMRATPCGLLATLDDAIDMAMWQASLTHGTQAGMASAAAVAATVWYCRRGCDLSQLPSLVDESVPGWDWEPWKGSVSSAAIPVVRAMVTTLARGGTMTTMLRESVAYTGDVDTVAALVMAAASLHPGVPNDLPRGLYHGLEDGPYGRKYLDQLSETLLKKFPLV